LDIDIDPLTENWQSMVHNATNVSKAVEAARSPSETRPVPRMDQLLGSETGCVFNDEALAVATGAMSPEQAAQTIENS
jgi:hypothetical protein